MATGRVFGAVLVACLCGAVAADRAGLADRHGTCVALLAETLDGDAAADACLTLARANALGDGHVARILTDDAADNHTDDHADDHADDHGHGDDRGDDAHGDDDAHGAHAGHHEKHERPYEALIYMSAALMIGAATLYVISRFLEGVPYTMAVFILGVVLALAHHGSQERLGVYSRSLKLWEHINPELLLYSFMPILLFGDAMQLNLHLFYTKMRQCITLAGPGVLLASFVTAFFARHCLPYDWKWWNCCVFGSITAATDPVAVVALLNALGASPGLTMAITGESLFNDGTAMVLFYLFMSLAEDEGRYIAGPGDPAGYGSIARFFLKMVLGGIGLGFAFGFAALVCLQLARRKYDETATTLQITVTVGVAYLSFYVADSLCGCSGVLSTVFAALVIARFGWVHVTSRETMVSVWEFLGYLANTLIFMLAGSLTGEILYENWHERGGDEPHWLGPYDYFVLLYTWAALMLIRGVMMVGLWPLLSYFERHHSSTKMLDWRDGVVMTWGGLRGAVGLALAMVVDEHIEVAGITVRAAVKFPQQLLFLVAGVSFLTLLVNGWTSASLLNYLKMTTPSEDTKHLRIYARTQAEKKAAEAFAEIANKYGLAVDDGPRPDRADAASKWHVVRSARNLGIIRSAMAYDAATFGGGVVAAGLADDVHDGAPVAAGDVPQRMRGLFLRTLKAEYWKMIELGLIPPGSAASQILPISCDAAMDHIATDLRDFMVVERAARDLKGAEYLNKVEGGCVKAFGFAASSNQRYYVLLAYKAAHLHTLAHVRDVFAYFVSSGAFAVDLRADFYAEVEAQIAQCQAYMDQTFPREEHAAINRDLVAEVLLEIKHDVYVKLEEEGLLATKDRDILAEHLIEATNELHKKRAEDAERLRRSTLELAKEKKANAKKGRVAPADDAEAKDAEPEPDAAAAKLQARVRGKQERAHPKAPTARAATYDAEAPPPGDEGAAPPAGVAYDVDVAAVAAAPAAAPGLVAEETPRAKSPSNRLAPLQ